MKKTHIQWMKRAIQLAEKARGYTSPNPMVGCVIVDEQSNKIGEGFHKKAGEDHAEVVALKDVRKNNAEDKFSGATLYVNLEPCCHYGKTPPCTKAIIQAGIKKVVVGSVDANPQVAGKGIEELKKAGLEVEVGVLKKECDELNKFFFHWFKTKRPWVTLKIAATLDGFIHLGKHGRQITGPEVQKVVHKMRAEHDAVLTGSGTVIDDDPQLIVRLVRGKNPTRVILDRRLRCEPTSKVFDEQAESILFTTETNKSPLSRGFRGFSTFDGTVDDVLKILGEKGIQSVLVEAGKQINTSFLESNLFNEIFYFVSPKLYGKPDEKKVSIYDGFLRELQICDTEAVGSDLLLKISRTD